MSTAVASPRGKKILLVVANLSSRNLRANVFRTLGVDVVCAAHLSDARDLWHPDVYDLVRFDMNGDSDEEIRFSAEMKSEFPAQSVVWLVGAPEFLSQEPLPDRRLALSTPFHDSLRQMLANACEALPHRGGFLEARWQMALRRSTLPHAPQHRSPRFLGLQPTRPHVESKPRDTFAEAVLNAQAEQERSS